MAIRVLACCFNSKEGDVEGNVARAAETIRSFARERPVDLVLLPEMFTAGYCGFDVRPFAEDLDSPTFAVFQALAEELDALVGWGFFLRAGDRPPYDAYALAQPGKAPTIATKTHLHLGPPGHRGNEVPLCSPGDQLVVVDTRIGRLGVMICAEAFYPEVPRCLALAGADCLLFPARASGAFALQGMARIRAMENIIPVVHPDGSQSGEFFPDCRVARGQIIDERGVVLADSEEHGEMLYARLDLERARALRLEGYDVWAARRRRRPELYGLITAPDPMQGATGPDSPAQRVSTP